MNIDINKLPCDHGARIIVGMSGGVDSSVTALLLKQQGYVVEGMFMKNWEEDDGTDACRAKEDLADAQCVADRLKIPLHIANFAAEYWENVFEHFLSEYRAGRTPNPDVLCNKEIKFKAFLNYALDLGAEYVATGHYVRTYTTCVTHQTGRPEIALLKGVDSAKDQSYFLCALSNDQLSKSLFPLGSLHKSEVRSIAGAYDLSTTYKKDSTGICFIGKRKFSHFLKRYLSVSPGDIVTLEGYILGQHHGLMYHTIGQRQGLKIGGVKGSSNAPWYVVDKRVHSNQLIVAQGKDHPALYAEGLFVEHIHWLGEPPDITQPLAAKIRYRQQEVPCKLLLCDQGFLVHFALPQRAVTPGQFVVFYSGERCLGGGVIMEQVVNVAMFLKNR